MPKAKSLIAVFALALLIAGLIFGGWEYVKYHKAIAEVKESWVAAQLLAGEQKYAEAILAAEKLIAEYPKYATKQKIQYLKGIWEKMLVAQRLWFEAKQLAVQLKYEQAIVRTRELLEEYPDSYFTNEAKSQLALWEGIVFRGEKIATYLKKAQDAKDVNDLEAAFEAVMSVLELDAGNEQAKALKAEIEAGLGAQRKAAEKRERFEGLKSQAISFESKEEWESAIKLYTEALTIEPDNAEVKARLTLCQYNLYLDGARAAEVGDDLDTAVDLYTKALSCKDNPLIQKKLDSAKSALQAQRAAERMRLEMEEWLRLATEAEAAGDMSEAVGWYRKAADRGNGGAMYKLGIAYHSGDGVTRDYARAVKWYGKAADRGNGGAMYKLGIAYHSGDGVARNYARAVEWYGKAAGEGMSEAMYKLGVMYHDGDGVLRDYKKTIKWYRRTAEAGNSDAMVNLGLMNYDGDGVGQDYIKAVEWFDKGAEAGQGTAMYYLGQCYRNGEGVGQDYVKAIEWYRKAAESGESKAMFSLGWAYSNKEGVDVDYAEAVSWYRRAAEAGEIAAMYYLGVMYQTGKGVAKDYEQVVYWYRKAARLGDKQAKERLVKLKVIW